MADDRIHIEQLELLAVVGVPEAERTAPQRLLVNITLTPRGDLRNLGDNLERTVDYAAVCDAVRDFVQGCSFKLIETLAEEMASLIKARFAVAVVEIELRKFILPDTAYVAVRVVR